jgi:2C-methyl-D-erythritol 2,4-cyclodiphosphate synthase
MTRVGIGYDSHRFVADRPLVLGGFRTSAGWRGTRTPMQSPTP